MVLPIMLTTGILFVLLIIEPWLTLTGISALYLISIPFSIYHYYRWPEAEKDAEE